MQMINILWYYQIIKFLQYCDSNIILFPIAPCKDITLIYGIISLKQRNNFFALVGRAITMRRATQK